MNTIKEDKVFDSSIILNNQQTMKMFIGICYLVLALAALECQSASIRHIVGGSNATECEFPNIVFLDIIKGPLMDLFQCSGSLIDNRHILTAAHCLEGDVLKISAWFGSLHTYEMSHEKIVSNFSVHKDYKETNTTIFNDVAVLKLSEPVHFNACLKSIRMADAGEELSKDCVIAGWGKTGEHFGASPYLQRADVPQQTPEMCAKIDSNIIKQHICVGTFIKGDKSTCQGDSGGPLTCTSQETGEKVLVGVVSYGWTCTEGLAVFARVAYFKTWIEQQIQNME